jgi:AcrR family transcriptional regulator
MAKPSSAGRKRALRASRSTASPPGRAAGSQKLHDAAAPALTRGLIVQAALELVNDVGLAAFSTRKLGERLGCEAMSIYHHFPSKQHLLDALVDHAISSVEVAPPGPNHVARLRQSMASFRAMARRWPALFPLVATHRLNTAAGVRFLERLITLIRAGAPSDEAAARQFRVMGYYLMGAGLDETAGYAKGPSAAEPVSNELIAHECPHLMAAGPYFQPSHWDATFEYGVTAMLKGMGLADS